MSEVLTKVIVDCATGEKQVIPFTPEEMAQREIDIAAFAEVQAQRQAELDAKNALKASAKAKLIAGEPLTAEEADTIVL